MRKSRLSITLLALATFAYAEEIDAEIIRHLDFFQNMDLLENMDTLESADEAELEETSSDEPAPADKESDKKTDKEAV